MHTLLASPLPFLTVISLENALPISFASRETTTIESHCPQLDLEVQAIDFGLHRFRQYIVGGPPVDIKTDHRPLENIFVITRLGSIRTDRTKLRCKDIDYNVKWRLGRIDPADYLSRHATPLSEG